MDNPESCTILRGMKFDSDILIIGGGLNGPALALALADGGLSVTIIDALPQMRVAMTALTGAAMRWRWPLNACWQRLAFGAMWLLTANRLLKSKSPMGGPVKAHPLGV